MWLQKLLLFCQKLRLVPTKSAQLMSDYDILVHRQILMSDYDMQKLKKQKLEELKLQILAQNPQLLGVGMPVQQD